MGNSRHDERHKPRWRWFSYALGAALVAVGAITQPPWELPIYLGIGLALVTFLAARGSTEESEGSLDSTWNTVFDGSPQVIWEKPGSPGTAQQAIAAAPSHGYRCVSTSDGFGTKTLVFERPDQASS